MPWAIILLAALAIMNIVTSIAFAIDKLQAQRNGRRIPRWHLTCLLWVAPFLPTVCMVWLHHKIRKRLFMISSCLAGTLQTGGLIWVLLHWDLDKRMVVTLVAFLFVVLWAASLLIQLRRGCACESSTVHAREPRVTQV